MNPLAPGDAVVWPPFSREDRDPPVYWLFLGVIADDRWRQPLARMFVPHSGRTVTMDLDDIESWERL